MKIRIETYSSNKYDEILQEYGKVLLQFGLTRTDEGHAEIYIGTLGDVLGLHKEIEEFINNSDKLCCYFGLMIKSYDDGTLYLVIKDNFD